MNPRKPSRSDQLARDLALTGPLEPTILSGQAVRLGWPLYGTATIIGRVGDYHILIAPGGARFALHKDDDRTPKLA